MKTLEKFLRNGLLTILISGFFSANVYAYIDPGSGAYAVQAFLALVAAILFYIRHPIEFIKSLFRKIFKKK